MIRIVSSKRAMEAMICGKGGRRVPTLTIIKMGEKKGIRDNTTDNELFGARMTNITRRNGTTRDIVTGNVSC